MIKIALFAPKSQDNNLRVKPEKPPTKERGRDSITVHCIIDLPIGHIHRVPNSPKTQACLKQHGIATIEDLYRLDRSIIASIERKALRNALLHARDSMHRKKFIPATLYKQLCARKHRTTAQKIAYGIDLFEDILKHKQTSLKALHLLHRKNTDNQRPVKIRKQASIRYIRKNIDRIAIAI